MAIVGHDGILRIVDLKLERLVFAAAGYFGSLLCVAWSHDGKYILTGGQDDLVRSRFGRFGDLCEDNCFL